MTALCAQQDSGSICLTFPEFDYYARAVVERRHLQRDTSVLWAYTREAAAAFDAQTKVQRQDSTIIAQKSRIIVAQQGIIQQGAADLQREERRKKFWRAVAVIGGVAAVVFMVR